MKKVVIEISGGNLQAVYVSKELEDAQVVVIDHDNLEDDPERPADGYQFERIANSEIQHGVLKQVVFADEKEEDWTRDYSEERDHESYTLNNETELSPEGQRIAEIAYVTANDLYNSEVGLDRVEIAKIVTNAIVEALKPYRETQKNILWTLENIFLQAYDGDSTEEDCRSLIDSMRSYAERAIKNLKEHYGN